MTIKTYTLTKGEVSSVNTLASITVGAVFDIKNESRYNTVYLKESATLPATDRDDSRSLSATKVAYIPADSEQIWVYSPYSDITISVQAY